MDPWGQLWHSGVVEHLTAVQLVGGLIQNWKMFWFKLDMARVFQVRHQDRFNCVELRPFQWVIRLPLLFDCMLGRLERGIILMVVVDAILTMSRENFQIVKFVAIHLRLLRLGKVFLSLNKDRQKFHLTRYCRTFKNSRVTEYLKCTACGEPGWRFYARFSTSSVKSCFFDFRYARISVSVCCRSQLVLSGMGWDAMYISGMHLDCTTFGTKVSILTSHRKGVWKSTSVHAERSVACILLRIWLYWWSTTLWMSASRCVVEILLNIIFGWYVFRMKSLRLDVSYCIVEIWAIIICERQIYHAFPCSTSIMMVNKHNRYCGCTRYAL